MIFGVKHMSMATNTKDMNGHADQNHFVLPEAQMTKFLESLEEEPRDIPELRAMFARKSVFESEDISPQDDC